MKKLFLVVFAALFLVGCSTTVPVNYVPSPIMKGTGKVDVGDFTYEPADQGKVKQNQYQQATGSIGAMYIPEDAGSLLAGALKKELVASGFDVTNDANIEIVGNIKQFKYDWIGFVEVDFYLDVEYTVIKKGSVVFKEIIKSHKAAPKTLAQDSEATRAAISSNITDLLQKLRSKKIL